MIGTALLLLHNPDLSPADLRDLLNIPNAIMAIRAHALDLFSSVISKYVVV